MIHRLKFNRFAGRREPKGPEQYAAVAILIYKNKEILFIKRSENMPTHKGHIAFPGGKKEFDDLGIYSTCLLYTSPSPRDRTRSRMPSSA